MTIELLARTSAILMAGTVIAALLRRAAPSTRHLVWHFAILAVLATPLVAPFVPRIAVPGVPHVPGVPKGIVLNAVPGSNGSIAEPRTVGTQQNDALGTPETLGTFGTVMSIGSLAVAAWFLFCWVLSGVAVWRGSKPAPERWLNEAKVIAQRIGLKGPVHVRQTLTDGSPHVAGFFESVVMMPPAAMTWTMEARQAALVHELTHIKRHDRRTQAIAQLACAIYWFNPLVWYAAAGLARERERACDDEVLRFGAKPSAYATLLLDLARAPGSAWTPATALSMARPSAIEGRLLSILDGAARTPRRSTRWVVGFAIMSITTAILGAQAATPIEPAAARQTPPRAPTSSLMGLDDGAVTQAVTGALVDAMRDSDGQVREQAAMGLAITPGADVIEPLINALKDPDAQVREKAAIGLAFRRDPKIVDPLLTAIEDIDGQVREKAAIALGASGDARAIAALTRATHDPDSQVREKAVAGLVLLGLRR
jgi:bla regulator protein blaR1